MFLQFEKFPLLAACERGHTETAKLLIDRGTDINMFNEVGIT